MPELLAASGEVYSELKNLIVWVKDNGGMGTFYRSRHELIFAFKYGTAPHVNSFELGQHGRYGIVLALLVATSGGYAKRTAIEEYSAQGRGGKGILTIQYDRKRGTLVGALIVDDEEHVVTGPAEHHLVLGRGAGEARRAQGCARARGRGPARRAGRARARSERARPR